jgi:23S rRNA pseudouridine1911/1915/1917 synthase
MLVENREDKVVENIQLKPGSTVGITVMALQEPMRIDQFLARSFIGYSRSFFQNLIASGSITVNGIAISKPRLLIKPHDAINIHVPSPRPLGQIDERARQLPIELIYEHEHFLIVSKPAGIITHQPHISSDMVTLVDWLIYYYKELATGSDALRPGIVHRLDRDTSGLLIVARTDYAHAQFSAFFKDRAIHKTYLALVSGHPEPEGVIDFAINRHPTDPTRMTHTFGAGRQAKTHYRVSEFFKDSALIELNPVTGRTHQIRVHCAAIGHPLLGDSVYGSASKVIKRQALHACQLSFEFEGIPYTFYKEPPADFMQACQKLRTQ